ncbi:MAG: hypothetical protein CSA62_03910 [Planctomycetota bacterium]|nr:MAG: hypothetical protein CSA62_03910 [Planctomycetota bacterium]
MSIEYYAPCSLGLEPALAHELRSLGAERVHSIPGGAEFFGDRALGYRAVLWLRSAIRVQEILHRIDASTRDRFYKGALAIDWSQYMDVDQTFQIEGKVRDSKITHSKFAALVLKDAIADRFRKSHGRRPNVDKNRADLPLRLLIREDEAVISRDLAGMSLHKRGYRPLQVKAPLGEAIAAGLLLLSGWDRSSPLLDPMCGSGTFVIEAALLASGRAPGAQRRFALERWIDLDESLWRELRQEAEGSGAQSLPFDLLGADRHAGAIEIAKSSARAAGVAKLVRFEHSPVSSLRPKQAPGIVVCNPPYGERIGRGSDLTQSWRDLGSFLHDHADGADAWILSGDKFLTKALGLRARRRIPVQNANIDCRWLAYPMGAAELHFVPLDAAEKLAAQKPAVEKPRATQEAPLPSISLGAAEQSLDEDALRRERRKRQGPSPWVTTAVGCLEEGSRVLDLACGHGRHARVLLREGHQVVAVDKDLSQLGDLLKEQGLEALAADLETGGPWPLGEEQFDAIVVTNYLWRPLFPELFAALNYGGVLIYETFMEGQEEFGKPRNREHLLKSNELLQLCMDECTVLAFEQGVFEEPEPKCVQRILAQREPPSFEGCGDRPRD